MKKMQWWQHKKSDKHRVQIVEELNGLVGVFVSEIGEVVYYKREEFLTNFEIAEGEVDNAAVTSVPDLFHYWKDSKVLEKCSKC